MTRRVTVLDYGMGNLRSVAKSFERVGASVEIATEVPGGDAGLLVVPGQGHFGACVRTLGPQMDAVRDWIAVGRPYLGICLGLQVLFASSEEDDATGLGAFEGRVIRFRDAVTVPHIGWNTISAGPAGGPWLDGFEDERFYFVHSFFPAPADEAEIAAVTEHGERFCSAVARDAVFATQFHPEKSGDVGLALLERVLDIVEAA